MEHKAVVLIGMPGCGKTTLGRALARKLGCAFVDMDEFVEQISGCSVSQLFEAGEENFRNWETKACRELAGRKNTVISAGGGVVKRPENIGILHPCCVIIYIDRPVESIFSDICTSTRPLLKDGPQKLYELYRERGDLYRAAADFTVENKGSKRKALEQLYRIVLNLNQ